MVRRHHLRPFGCENTARQFLPDLFWENAWIMLTFPEMGLKMGMSRIIVDWKRMMKSQRNLRQNTFQRRPSNP
jgi:hypothetical protein